ncbi:MAG TPA: vitamin B12-dependent ribonucleotide reductase [Candidatus Paceibacterota bacterium]|nr:vitamin B12-dependent ribonucleotide reductase [Candidatus Paceibacterota bacterium]
MMTKGASGIAMDEALASRATQNPPDTQGEVNGRSAGRHTDRQARGLPWERRFGDPVKHPYDEVTWELRDARITRADGTVVFEQKGIEVPAFWSQTATDIVASKYFRGRLDSPERERSVKQMLDRVAKTLGFWGLKGGYFASADDAERYVQDLTWLLLNQYASFNSPVWFNVGMYDKPQCSACFILSVDDNMQSILNWVADEGWIFKYGSGSGTNLSRLRSSKESLSKGGFSSGPVSFMKAADGMANAIRSGGATRRAAKMVVLNADHPDIDEFIYCKKHIEEYTKILVSNGVMNSLDGDLFSPYTLLPYQNANNSVRVTDEFMRAVLDDADWDLKSVTTGKVLQTVKARGLMDKIADAAWHSADPGMQYDTTINKWNTVSNTGRINASNPCSEYMHLDNSACNLASLNLLKFLQSDGTIDIGKYKSAVDTVILGQEIVVDFSSYPTEPITKNARDFRELGLGYANLGALLMAMGLPYDSDGGRLVAGHLTSLMCGQAYRMSALIADIKGPYAGFATNREPQLNVIAMHLREAEKLYTQAVRGTLRDPELQVASRIVWHEALELAERHGVRNSQMTVLAPTGTIAFMMDCATTGVEPELALVKYKKLVGGGVLKLVNTQVPQALGHLGYAPEQVKEIGDYLLEQETIEGAPHLSAEHTAVFDCSFKAANGTRSISYLGHLKMMAAAQPFISGAISKTVNLPEDATKEDVKDVFIRGWELGLKAIAVYRDGSKGVQPLNTSKEAKKPESQKAQPEHEIPERPQATTTHKLFASLAGPDAVKVPVYSELVERSNGYTRIRLPDERPSVTHKFSVGGYEGYMTVGLYPDTGKPGELFLKAAKEGSTISGLLDTIATLASMCLQSGMPLKTLVRKFKDLSFAPAGFTNNADIPMAKSITDYIFRYIGIRYLSAEDREELFGPHANGSGPLVSKELPVVQPGGQAIAGQEKQETAPEPEHHAGAPHVHGDPHRMNLTEASAPPCNACGTLMFRAGSCYSCPNCFNTTGVCN